MDKEAIRKALDNFEEDKFTDAKEVLQKEIRAARDEYLAKKLDLTVEEEEMDDEDEEMEDGKKKKKKKMEDDE
jgi:hypothetical protein